MLDKQGSEFKDHIDLCVVRLLLALVRYWPSQATLAATLQDLRLPRSAPGRGAWTPAEAGLLLGRLQKAGISPELAEQGALAVDESLSELCQALQRVGGDQSYAPFASYALANGDLTAAFFAAAQKLSASSAHLRRGSEKYEVDAVGRSRLALFGVHARLVDDFGTAPLGHDREVAAFDDLLRSASLHRRLAVAPEAAKQWVLSRVLFSCWCRADSLPPLLEEIYRKALSEKRQPVDRLDDRLEAERRYSYRIVDDLPAASAFGLASALYEGSRGKAGLMAAMPATALSVWEALGFQAIRLLCAGDVGGAEESFAAAEKIYAKAAGKRKIALPSWLGVFHLLCLAAQRNLSAVRVKRDILRRGSLLTSLEARAAWCIMTADTAASLEQVSVVPTRREERECIFFAILIAIARKNLRIKETAAQAGTWQKIAVTLENSEALLFKNAAKLLAGNPSPGDDAAPRANNGGVLDLIDVLSAAPLWEAKLGDLEAFLSSAAKATPKTKAVRKAPAPRLVWSIGLSSYEVEIELRLQVLKSSGWTTGKTLPLSRLERDEQAATVLTDSDRSLAAMLLARGSTWPRDADINSRFAPTRALFEALAKVAAVAWAEKPTVLVPVRFVQPRLFTQVTASGTALQVEPALPDGGWSIGAGSDGAVEIFCPTASEGAAMAAFGHSPVEVPAAAKERLDAILDAFAAMKVFAIERAEKPQERRAVDYKRLYVQVRVDGLDFEFKVKVRPLGEHGPATTPGLGSKICRFADADRLLVCDRDLTVEEGLAGAFMDELAESGLFDEFERLLSGFRVDLAMRNFEFQVFGLEAFVLTMECFEQIGSVGPAAIIIEWPHDAPLKLAKANNPAQLMLSRSSGTDWLGVSGTIATDAGKLLPIVDVLKAWQAAPPAERAFLRIGTDQLLRVSKALRLQLEGLSKTVRSRRDGGLVVHAATLAGDRDEERAFQPQAMDKLSAERIAEISAAFAGTPATPAGLAAGLRPYQKDGITWLLRLQNAGLGACLADDMGLGKTIQAMACLLHAAKNGPALVIAPTSVCGNWCDELAKFAPSLNVVRLEGSGRSEAALAALKPHDVCIVSYTVLQIDAALFAGRRWAVAIADEAQAIKNPLAARSRAVHGLDAAFRLALSGTPVENRESDLWSIFEFVVPGLLGERTDFLRRFATERGAAEERKALRATVSPFILRRTKNQVLKELPSKIEVTKKVDLSADERLFYEALRVRAQERVAEASADGKHALMEMLAEITRMRRACCAPLLADEKAAAAVGLAGSSKLEAALELIEEALDNEHRVIVFSQFVDFLKMLGDQLARRDLAFHYLDGSTSADKRTSQVRAFQAGEKSVFLVSLKAGGTGLNLTGADFVIHLDPWWNPAVEDQATDRAYRIGQTRPVTVYRLITNETIEEKVLALHGSKRALADELLADAGTPKKLDAALLRELMS